MNKNRFNKRFLALLMGGLIMFSSLVPVSATSDISTETSEEISSETSTEISSEESVTYTSEVQTTYPMSMTIVDPKGNKVSDLEFTFKDQNNNIIQFVTSNGN